MSHNYDEQQQHTQHQPQHQPHPHQRPQQHQQHPHPQSHHQQPHHSHQHPHPSQQHHQQHIHQPPPSSYQQSYQQQQQQQQHRHYDQQQHASYMQQQAALAYQHNQEQLATHPQQQQQQQQQPSYTSPIHTSHNNNNNHPSITISPSTSGTSTPTSILSPSSTSSTRISSPAVSQPSTPSSAGGSTGTTATATGTPGAPGTVEGKKARISKACDSCRRRKRKCDGARPICGACARLSLPCAYPASAKKRGPQAGVVKRLRADLKTLESQVKIERTSTSKSARLSSPASALRISTILDSIEYRRINDTYLKSYFELLNATMFPFLEQESFMEERIKYQQQEDLEQPLSWALRFGAVLAVGALMYGDRAHASAADRIAREAASNLFDQPSLDVIRGLHVLSFYCIGSNLQSRAACYLAVATRMTTILSGVGEEMQLMCNVLEDTCYSINWWYIGFDQTPETGFREPEQVQTKEDREMYFKYMSVRGQTESEEGPPTGPNARAEMLRLMVLLSSHRGDFSRRPVGIWRMLLVLTKIEDSKYCAGPIRTLIRLQKAVTLRLLAHDPASHHEALLAANAAIEAAQTHDVTHCPFYCLLLHGEKGEEEKEDSAQPAAGQIHLAAGDSDPYIAVEVDLLEKIAAKWDFVTPVLTNFRQRLTSKFTSSPNYSNHLSYALPVAHFTPDIALSSQDLKKAAAIFSTLTSPIPPASNNNNNQQQSQNQSQPTQVTSPVHSPSSSHYNNNSGGIDETIASIHNQFKHSLNLEAQSDLASYRHTTSIVHPTSHTYNQQYYQTYASYGYAQGGGSGQQNVIRNSNSGNSIPQPYDINNQQPPQDLNSQGGMIQGRTTSAPMAARPAISASRPTSQQQSQDNNGYAYPSYAPQYNNQQQQPPTQQQQQQQHQTSTYNYPTYPIQSRDPQQHYPYPSQQQQHQQQHIPAPTVALQSLHSEIASLDGPVSPSLPPLPIIPSSSSLPATDFLLSDIDKATPLNDPNLLLSSFPSSSRDQSYDFLSSSPAINTISSISNSNSQKHQTHQQQHQQSLDLSITPMSVPSALVSAFNEAQGKPSPQTTATSSSTSIPSTTSTSSTAATSTSAAVATSTSTATSTTATTTPNATSPSLTAFQQAAQQRQQQQQQQQQHKSPPGGLSQQLQQQHRNTITQPNTWQQNQQQQQQKTTTPTSPYQQNTQPGSFIPSFHTRPTSNSTYPEQGQQQQQSQPQATPTSSSSQHYESASAQALAQAKQRTDIIKQQSNKQHEMKPIIPGSHIPSSVLSTYTQMSYQQRSGIGTMGPPQPVQMYQPHQQQQQQQQQQAPAPQHEPIMVLPASVDMQQATPMSADTAMVADFLTTPGSGVGSLLGPQGMSGMSASPGGDHLLQKTTAFEQNYF